MNDHLFDNELLQLRWRWLWARCESGLDAYEPIARAWLDLRLNRKRRAALAFLLTLRRHHLSSALNRLRLELEKNVVVYPPLSRFNRRPS